MLPYFNRRFTDGESRGHALEVPRAVYVAIAVGVAIGVGG
jgi:hypothetical protein